MQLNIRRPEVLTRYAERDTTLREHTALIKEYYGYHEFGDFPWSFRLKRLLYTRAWLSNERPGLMFDFATAWLLQNKVLLPGATTLVRLVSEIRERANQRLWKKLAALPDSWQTARVTELLDIPEGQRTSPLERTGHRQRPGIYRSAGAVYPAAKPGIFPTEFYRSACYTTA